MILKFGYIKLKIVVEKSLKRNRRNYGRETLNRNGRRFIDENYRQNQRLRNYECRRKIKST